MNSQYEDVFIHFQIQIVRHEAYTYTSRNVVVCHAFRAFFAGEEKSNRF